MSRSLPHNDPPLIKLIRYGILGGLAATPVSIVFRDFPADLLSQLWGAVVKVLPPGTVVEAWSHADIQRLRRDPHEDDTVNVMNPTNIVSPVSLVRSGNPVLSDLLGWPRTIHGRPLRTVPDPLGDRNGHRHQSNFLQGCEDDLT